jgi:hypothetical protein
MKKLKFLLIISFAIAAFLFGSGVNAQQIEVTPGKLSFTANPGSSQTQQILVRNNGVREQSYIFNLADWLTDEENQTRYFEPGSISRSCADWITISPNLLTLQPNEQAAVNVTMLVPENENSTKWAVIFVQAAREQVGPTAVDKDVELGVNLTLRIAVPVFQSPVSNTLYKGTLEGLTQTIEEDGTRTFDTQVMNLGDKILNCKVYFIVSSLETGEEFTSDPIEFSLLPESNRNISYQHEEMLSSGKYSVAAILDYGYNDELEGIQLDIDVK